jgi:hypothetical protein
LLVLNFYYLFLFSWLITNQISKFKDANGSTADGPENGPLNIVDEYEEQDSQQELNGEIFSEDTLSKIEACIITIPRGSNNAKHRVQSLHYQVPEDIDYDFLVECDCTKEYVENELHILCNFRGLCVGVIIFCKRSTC